MIWRENPAQLTFSDLFPSLTNPKKPKSYKKSHNSPKPTMPRVSPRMRAHPEAASFSCSGPVIFLPSLTMLASQKVRRYKLRMRHSVESATSSTPYPGTLQTAMPSSPAAWKKWRKKSWNHRRKNLCYLILFWTTFMITHGLIFNSETFVSSIGSTETKYIKLNPKFLLLFFKFSTHFLLAQF